MPIPIAKEIRQQLNPKDFERIHWNDVGIYTIQQLTEANIAITPRTLRQLQPMAVPGSMQDLVSATSNRHVLFFEQDEEPYMFCLGELQDSDMYLGKPDSPLTLPLAHISGAKTPDFRYTAFLQALSHDALADSVDIDEQGFVSMSRDTMLELNEGLLQECGVMVEELKKLIEKYPSVSDESNMKLVQELNEMLRSRGINIQDFETSYLSYGVVYSNKIFLARITNMIDAPESNIVAKTKRYKKDKYTFEGMRSIDTASNAYPLADYYVFEEAKRQAAQIQQEQDNEKQKVPQAPPKHAIDLSKTYNNVVKSPEPKKVEAPSENTIPREQPVTSELSRDDVRGIILKLVTGSTARFAGDEYIEGLAASILASYGNPSLDDINPSSLRNLSEDSVLRLINSGHLGDLEFTLLSEILRRNSNSQ